MERRLLNIAPRSRRALRRWAREIVLAAALTAVAAAFILGALLRGNESSPEPLAFEAARKPSGK
jgi:hypothetical protein